MIRAGILGATGYAGAELVRLLSGHPDAELAAVGSVSYTGKPLSEIYPAYYGLCDKICGTQEEVLEKSNVVFAALPSGLSQEPAKLCREAGKTFIDLGADFRLKREGDYREWYKGTFRYPELHEEAVYGLPELFREKIRGKKLIANPGCYTTAVPLALAPALESGLILPLEVDTAVALKDGDAVTVQHNGQTFSGRAGLPFHRTFCNTVPLSGVKIA